MKKKWRVLYYSTIDGKTPVKDFINSRSVRNRQKIAAVLEHLENVGIDMRRPFFDYLKDDKLAKSLWLSFLRMQESIEYRTNTELFFLQKVAKSNFSDLLQFCQK